MYEVTDPASGAKLLMSEQDLAKFVQPYQSILTDARGNVRQQLKDTKKIIDGYSENGGYQMVSLTGSQPSSTLQAVGNNSGAGVAAGPTAAASTTPQAAGCPRTIAAGEGFMARQIIGANTDDGSTEITAKIISGRLRGDSVLGNFVVGQDDMSFRFNKLSEPLSDENPGRSFSISAIAINPTTMEKAMADSVNTHWFSKYGSIMMAGLLQGLGQAATLNATTGTVVSTPIGNGNQVITNTNVLSNKDIALIAAGGVGNAAAAQFSNHAASIKDTIKSAPNKVFGVVFLEDVVPECRH
jgi:hypothetical protein